MRNSIASEEPNIIKIYSELIDSTNDSVIVTDAVFEHSGPRIVYVNNNFLRESGYSKEEVIGRSPRFLQGRNSCAKTLRRLRYCLESNRDFCGELINYRKNGEEYHVLLNITPVRNSLGKVAFFASLQKNITPFKLLESRILKSNALLKSASSMADVTILSLGPSGEIYEFYETRDCKIQEHLFKNVDLLNQKNIFKSIHSDHREGQRLLECIAKVLNGKNTRFKMELVLGADEHNRFVYEIKGEVFSYSPNCYAVITFKNVTDFAERVLEISAINHELERRVQERTHDLEMQAAAMDSNMEGQAVMRGGSYIYMNLSHAQMYGYEPEELMGKSWEVLYDEEVIESIRKESMTALSEKGQWIGELRGLKKSGEHFDVEVNLRLRTNNDLICTCRDITDQKSSQLKLYKQNILLKAIAQLDSSQLLSLSDPVPFFQKFLQIILEYTNSGTGVMALGYGNGTVNNKESKCLSKGEITWQTTITDNVFKEELDDLNRKLSVEEFFRKMVQQFPSPIKDRELLEFLNKNIGSGGEIYEHVLCMPVECSTKIIGLLVIARSKAPYERLIVRELDPVLSAFENILDAYNLDLHRKKSEEIEKQRTLELAKANFALAKASKLKDEFLASMSHELRTPISGILNLNETMEDEVLGSLNQNQRRYCQLIGESGRHLLSLINDILDLAKIESNQLELHMEENSLNDIALSSIRLVSEVAKIRQQTIKFELVGLDHFGMVDRRRMIQVLVNLISNAIKFSPIQSVINIKAKFLNAKQIARYTVCDEGIGISEDKIDLLFQPFVQLDSELDRDYEGTGLGLVLVKKFVTAHGGEVSVQSQIGVGSSFTVEVPFKMKRDQK